MSVLLISASLSGRCQLFDNLQSLVYQVRVGFPASAVPVEGPKGIATTDFDKDGRADIAVSGTDGSVTVYFGDAAYFDGAGGRFGLPLYLDTGLHSLRAVVCGDLDGDGLPDIVSAAPFAGQLVIFLNQGGRSFSAAMLFDTWQGARNLEMGDFDGDGAQELVVAGANIGLRQYQWAAGAGLVEVAEVGAVNRVETREGRFPKPVYSLRTWRGFGMTQDDLFVTHADTNRIWRLSANGNGELAIVGEIPVPSGSRSMAIGPLLFPATAGGADLVTAQRDGETIEVHARDSSAMGFESGVRQLIHVPGGPRAVEIVDLDGDGWNDLVVVLRNLDRVVTYANRGGTLVLEYERPVGASPREMIVARLDDDPYPDLVVINRKSSDAHVLLAYPQQVGYTSVDHIYLVDGGVSGLAVVDFNDDGRDDVIQLHRASGDFSVRLAGEGGALDPPTFYTVGNLPVSQVITDVNNDGNPDQVCANLGSLGVERGSVSVSLGNGDGTFGPEIRIELPEGVEGRLFALVPVDMNRDGNIDLAAGFLDSRVAFFEGGGNGEFTYTRTHAFVQLARGLVAGDFDGDQDPDLAGVGVRGEIWVVQNQGDLLETTALTVQVYTPPEGGSGDKVRLVDLNEDDDLDLVVGDADGALIYHGGPGMSFQPPVALPGTAFPVADVIQADFDDDGEEDLILACRLLDCLSVFSKDSTGEFIPLLTVNVPASDHLATGDLDGDGLPDLVGSGRLLWTALSGHSPNTSPPLELAGGRQRLPRMVINEVLAINLSLALELDNGHEPDWIEFYNGSDVAVSLNGWRIELTTAVTEGGPVTNQFWFPPTAFVSSRAHLLVFCDEEVRTVYHTGWNLSGEGGAVDLFDPDGVLVDRVHYGRQRGDVSLSRYADGLRAFVLNPFPSPGRPNAFNGAVEVNVAFEGVDPATVGPGVPLRFSAVVDDYLGVATLTVYLQRLDEPNAEVQRVALYDDGLHEDGALADGRFSGLLPGGLPAGAELQYYLQILDLSDVTTTLPEEPEFGLPGRPGNAFAIGIGLPVPGLEISEVVSDNLGSLLDEFGGTPDWVEVRNVSGSVVSLNGLSLSQQLGEGERYSFPPDTQLGPAEYFLVYCDGQTGQGVLHAPFGLNRDGDAVLLSGVTTNGARTLVDWVRFGPLGEDQAFARVGVAGPWMRDTPTPRACNLERPRILHPLTTGSGSRIAFAFPTVPGKRHAVELSPSLSPAAWVSQPMIDGNGIEQVVELPMWGQGYFRVRTE